jgi:hypothetical protein
MSTLPETWDNLKFIDGIPGKFVVLARRKGDNWYIAGINGEDKERIITMDVPFIQNPSKGIIITDSDNLKDFVKRGINLSTPIQITLYPYGGFIIKTSL